VKVDQKVASRASRCHGGPMPFQSEKGASYKIKFRHGDRTMTAGTGTRIRRVADDVEHMLTILKQDGRDEVLDAIIDRRLKLRRAYKLWKKETLFTTLKDEADTDLVPLLESWTVRGRDEQAEETLEKYKDQIRPMLGKAFRASEFTRARIGEYLDGLRKKNGQKMSGSTINRYHSALSRFADHLVERGVINANPMREVRRGKNPKPKPYWFADRADAMALVMKLEAPHRAAIALILACGAEWQAIRRLRRSDVVVGATMEESQVHTFGSKQEHRDRISYPTEEWAWKVFTDHLDGIGKNDLVFPGICGRWVLDLHKRAMKELELDTVRTAPMTIHALRHAYAVQALRDGYDYPAVAHNLGHGDTVLLQRIYGKWIPNRADFVRRTVQVPALPVLRLEANA